MTKKLNEAGIRDYLAQHLDLIERGLTLVDKEFYLRNGHGASGFLDIFARSANGQIVIIEIKRTDSAAREAIQELYKYVALLRERYLVKDVEYRLVLLSVEWHELLVPYSEFVRSAPYEISAGRIELGVDGRPARIEPVKAIPIATARRIGVRHFLWRFPSPADAKGAVPLLEAVMHKAGVSDFVLIESQSNDSRIREHGFLYFAQQELRFNEYMRLIERNLTTDELKEFRASIADLTEEEDRIAEASDAVWAWPSGAPYGEIGADHAEISHPEKARHWFEEGSQSWIHVHRFGRFLDDQLTDETIIAEIVGEGGESDYRLRFTARTDSPPLMKALAAKVDNIFFYNADWRGAVRDLMNYAERTGPATIELTVFTNEDILRAIAGAAFGYPGYMPTFRLDIVRGTERERFIGLPEWDGTKPDLDKIIAEHFEGNDFAYFTAVHFGENRHVNLNVMNDLGMRYGVYRQGVTKPERVRVQGSRIVVETRPIKGSISTMIQQNVEEVHKIVELFMNHDQGFAQTIEDFLNSDLPLAERRLAAVLEKEPQPVGMTYWSGDLDHCNRCGHPFAPLRFMINVISAGGTGANLCAKCFFEAGAQLGTGRGQAYEATPEGWRHVAG
jgi:hypothetical protein